MAIEITFQLSDGSELALPCAPNTQTISNRLDVGPLIEDTDITVFIRKGHFVTADNTIITVDTDLFTADNASPRPRAGKICEFRGQEWRILLVHEDPSGAYLKLHLGSAK
jgi:hypothetical protein